MSRKRKPKNKKNKPQKQKNKKNTQSTGFFSRLKKSLSAFFNRISQNKFSQRIVFYLPALAAGILSYNHLNDGFFYDEAYYLDSFESNEYWFNQLTHPHTPVSHMMASVLYSLWYSLVVIGDVIEKEIRHFPWVMFMLSTLSLTYFVKKISNGTSGIYAGMIFATSIVSTTFSCQLKGYNLSWIFTVLSAIAVVRLFKKASFLNFILYLLPSSFLLGILMQNAVIPFMLCLWMLTFAFHKKDKVSVLKLKHILLMGILPFFGLFYYFGVLYETMELVLGFSNPIDFLTNMKHWYSSTFRGLWLLIPLMLLGLVLMIIHKKRNPSKNFNSPYANLWFVLTCIVAIPLFILAQPSSQKTRLLVTYLPLWYAMFGLTVGAVFTYLLPKWKRFFCFAICTSLFCVAWHREWMVTYNEYDNLSLKDYHSLNEFPEPRLYDSYYSRNFYPNKLVKKIKELSKDKKTFVVIGVHDIRSIVFIFKRDDPSLKDDIPVVRRQNFDLVHYQYTSNLMETVFGGKYDQCLLVSHGDKSAIEIGKQHKMPSQVQINLIEDFGFYKIYRFKKELLN